MSIKRLWRIITHIGIEAQYTDTRKKRIRLLNQICLIILFFTCLHFLSSFFMGNYIIAVIALFCLPFYTIPIFLQQKNRLLQARLYTIIFVPFVLVVLSGLVAGYDGAEFLICSTGVLTFVFFDTRKYQIILSLYIILCIGLCRIFPMISDAGIIIPFNDFLASSNLIIGFISTIFFVSIFQTENMLFERKTNQLLGDIKQKNKDLARQGNLLQAAQKQLKMHNNILEQKVKQRTSALNQSNQELQHFAFITSHNLREPVANILGLIQLYDKQQLNNDINLTVINNLEVSAQNMDRLIKDLHKVVSIQKSQVEKKQHIQLEQRLVKILQSISKQIEASKVRIETQLQIPTLFSIPAYVDSILMNLISNAIKYRDPSKEPCTLTITSVAYKDQVCIRVCDNGIGIDLEKHGNKLFKLYTRLHPHIEGTGVGLHLIKRQIEALGGRIEVKSEVGVGTCFSVFL